MPNSFYPAARDADPIELSHNQQSPGDADPRDFKVNRAGPLGHSQDSNDPEAQKRSGEQHNRGPLPLNSVDRADVPSFRQAAQGPRE